MKLNLKWVGTEELDRVAKTRLRCYASAQKELPHYREGVGERARAAAGDYLLAEREGTGEAVGTTTSLSMTMWVRGAALPCQGVAWVGTIRTARRGATGSALGSGIASQLMNETLRRAREREQVVSALMPFRASFYEHFGYGVVERRARWTVPLSILPHSKCDGVRFYEPTDFDAVVACRQRQCETGQCDIETSSKAWENRFHDDDGFHIVDRPETNGPAQGFMFICDQPRRDDRRCVLVEDNGYDSPPALLRQLSFLSGLRDQYALAVLSLPTDVPLNHLLRESQVPHRSVEHRAAECSAYTRMQVRVLDHVRFFEKLKLPQAVRHIRGSATVAVRETEGHVSKFRLEVDSGRTVASPSEASPDVETSDVNWATIACGAIPASTAAIWQLVRINRPDVLPALDALSAGPPPFCNEYF